MVLAVAYLLWMVQRVVFQTQDSSAPGHLVDLTGREMATVVPMVDRQD